MRWRPTGRYEAVDALEVEDVRVGALEADGTVRAMVVDEHLVLCASRRELLEEARDLGVATVHEVDLEALRAELREVLRDLLLLAVDLGPRHPEDDAYALLVRIVNEVGNVDLRAVLPDVELRAPALVEDHVFDAGLRGEIDEAHIRLGRAALGIALVVEGVPPVPRDLAGLHPGEVGALRGRRRKRVEDVCLAKLGRRIGEREGAPGERARRIGLGYEVFRFLDLHPAAALLKPGFLAPAADALPQPPTRSVVFGYFAKSDLSFVPPSVCSTSPKFQIG